MALVVKDRVKETTTTTGTGTITLLGAVTGFQSFSSVGNGNTTYYTISDGTNWEVGIGTYTSAGSTLSRDTVLSSSNSGSLVNFGAGAKEVFVTYPASKSVYQDGTDIKANTSILAVANGGTGASSAASALTNLGAYPSSNPSGYTNNTGTVTSVDVSGGSTGLTATGGPITTSGTITLGGTLAAANGGTGQSSYTVGDILYASGTTALAKLADVATGNALISGGVGVAPSYGKIGLTTHVSGTLAVGNGGTGATTLTANGVLLGNGTSAISATAVGTTGQVLVGNTGAAPTWATLSSSAVTSFSAGTTGLTPSSATTGAITLAGTLNVANGGTGATSFTAGYHLKGNGTSAVSSSVIYDDGTNVGVGTASPTVLLDVFSATAANFSVRGDSATNITAHRSSTDASGPNAVLRKSRGTSASQTAVASGDTMGTLFFSAYGGANNRNIASIAGTVDTYYSDTGIGSYLTFSTTPNGSVTLAERMRIDNAGNVGIGTASPSSLGTLVVSKASSGTPIIALESQGSWNASISANSSGNLIFSNSASTERMRIDASGNVGIATSTPQTRFEVYGGLIAGSENRQTHPNANAAGGFKAQWNYTGGSAETDLYNLYNGASESFRFYQTTGSGTAQILYSMLPTAHLFYTGGSERMRIDSSGNVGIGTTAPQSKMEIRATSGGSTFNALTLSNYVGSSVNTGVALYFDPNGAGTLARAASIQSVQATSGNYADLRFFTANSDTPAERMRINLDGAMQLNVGGVSNTHQFLYNESGGEIQLIDSTGAGPILIDNVSGLARFYKVGSGAVSMGTTGANYFQFITNGSERMRIDVNGLLGVGTSAPASLLHVKRGSNATEVYPTGTWASRIINATDASGENGLVVGNRWAATTSTVFEVGSIYGGGTGSWRSFYKVDGVGNSIWSNDGSERMRLTTSGTLGLGLSTPNASLHIAGARGGEGRLTQMSTSNATAADALNIMASSSSGGSDQWYSWGVTSGNVWRICPGVGLGSSEAFSINSNSRVMVGSATTFDTTVGANFMSYGSAGSAAAFKVNSTSSTQVSFYDSTQSARVGWIGTSGSSTSYNTTSDRRLKQNIQPVSDVGDKIDQIEIVSHQWRNGTDTVIPYGMIAQDLYEVAPHAVTKGDNGDEVGLEWGVDYSKLVPMMIKEMQSMRARIAELEGK